MWPPQNTDVLHDTSELLHSQGFEPLDVALEFCQLLGGTVVRPAKVRLADTRGALGHGLS
jgi:hypothetical protein